MHALRTGIAAIAVAMVAVPCAAQEFAPPPTPTADALAAQMRVLAANPRDVSALIVAADLSTRLGDPAAALAFLARAQAVDAGNPRLLAGRANALVAMERPGEALRLFDQAERANVSLNPYLAQRGLAYDLTGQPGYAQRDYRRALLTDHADETVRRLALSLGISGRKDEAMALLDPLLRKSDRAAWRARACILAMSGDVNGARTIAASMMNGGAALAPFFGRLPSLSAADRAFAVHFGEMTPTAARINDARLAPAVAALPVEPAPVAKPVVVAAAAPQRNSGRDRSGRNRRAGRQPIVVVSAPMATPTAGGAVASRPLGTATLVPQPAPVMATSSVAAPAARILGQPTITPAPVAPQPAPVALASNMAAPAASRLAGQPTIAPVPLASTATVVADVRVPASTQPTPVAEPTVVAAQPVARPPVEITTIAAPVRAAPAPAPTVTPAMEVARATPAPVAATPRPEPARAAVRTPATARRNTALLASIIDGIDVPAEELAPAPAARKAPAKKVEIAKVETKRPDPKKADPKKPDPKKPDPAKTDPARWWVQVAGGANEADLGKDWKRLTTKSPTAFRGKAAYTTPLRATNRLLAGPFKGQDDAMAFVNALKKDGASTFAWQSEAGQKIEKLRP
ncbi:SPOR domain-containing protein [Sphingomonas donggukensis]|uniref:SPOR domain-containing protein n=1 Tax=Sphingomonas donggukensis TaxID=2949093 RepID=A0ABY4TWY1_9SPHN|nr:SPOR domain-containing protein [Sphingomonas donggukensis]URW76910.1 SPOR domain-containing protein [Sphingomonas donggukensis]